MLIGGAISFRNKSILVSVLTSGLALLSACVAFVIYDRHTFPRMIEERLAAQADIIAANCTAALTFDDPIAAEVTLKALYADPSIRAAQIFMPNRTIFASKVAVDATGIPQWPKRIPATFAANGRMHSFRPIELDGERIGIVYVQRQMNEIDGRMSQYAGISAAVLLLSLALAFLLSSGFMRHLMKPIAELGSVAHEISQHNDYTVRARKLSGDELGQLTDTFNTMLEHIQIRDKALEEARGQLERRVLERTHDLTSAKEAAERALNSLRESEEQTSAIVNTAADGIITVSETGLIERFNRSAERIFGYKSQEAIGQSVGLLFGMREGPLPRIFRFESRPDPGLDHELLGMRKNREGFPLSVRLAELYFKGRRMLIVTLSDISERKRAEAELAQANRKVVEMARQAGMAEVATGVLHNVGNVLNTVNVSVSLIDEQLRNSRVAAFVQIMDLIKGHPGGLTDFIVNDNRGRHLPEYLFGFAGQLVKEHERLRLETAQLLKNVEHIKDIVSMQQSYARRAGFTEKVSPSELLQDALRMNSGALVRHDIEVVEEYEEVPPIEVDKHKVLQILVNFIRNAKYAIDEGPNVDRRMTLRIKHLLSFGVRLEVADTGVGIPPEQLTEIFAHGFTTREHGHGFGLHASALAAKEMGGEIRVHSAGLGKGATFSVDLPVVASQSP